MKNEEFIISRKIIRLGNQLINNRNDDLKAYDLTAEQSETLQFFNVNRGTKVLDLKEHLNISHQAARNIVERMKKKELLYVEVSQNDARAKFVYLTAKGQKICDALTTLGTSVGHQLLRGITKEERALMLMVLEKMTANMK